jgi:GAF domain-containing protein
MSKTFESPRARNIKSKSELSSCSAPAKTSCTKPDNSLPPSEFQEKDSTQKDSKKTDEGSMSPRSTPAVSIGLLRRNSSFSLNPSGFGGSTRRSSVASNSIGFGVSTTIDMGMAVSNHMLAISIEKSVSAVAATCARGFAAWLSIQVVRVIGFEREKSTDRLCLLAACGENCASPFSANSHLLTQPKGLLNAGLTYKVARSGICIRSTCDSSDLSIPVDIGETLSPISGQIIVAPCLYNDVCVAVLIATASTFSDSEYIMFQQIAKMTGISIANSMSHQVALSSSEQCSLIRRAAAVLLRSRTTDKLSHPVKMQDSGNSDTDDGLETGLTSLESTNSLALSNLVICAAMFIKLLTRAKEAIVFIVDDKANSLYTWKSLSNIGEPEEALSCDIVSAEVKISSCKGFIDMVSQSKFIYSSNTSQDSQFEAEGLRSFISPPSGISCHSSDHQYSTMVVGISPTSADIFGSSDVSYKSNISAVRGSNHNESSIAIIIQLYDVAETFGQRRAFESFKGILEELGKILLNAITLESNSMKTVALDDGLLEMASCKRTDEIFACASELISTTLAVDWAAIYEVSDSGSFVWNGKASKNIPQSLGVGQHRKEILIGEAPVATYVINNNVPDLKPKFSQKGKGPVRIIRMGEQDYDDKRQRRLSGEIDRGIHPMMEAIKFGGPVHIPTTIIDMKLLPQDFDGKRFQGFKCNAVVACPCFDEDGNIVAVVVVGNKRAGGWCRTGEMTFSTSDVSLLQKISQHTGIAFSKARLFESFQFQQLYWFKLLELCQIISSTRDTTKIMDIIKELAPKVLGCERAVLFLRVPMVKELWTVLKPCDTSVDLADSNLTFEQRVYLVAKRKAESAQLQVLSEETYLVEFLKSVPAEVQSIFCRSLPLQTGLHHVPSSISVDKVSAAASSASNAMSSHSSHEIRVKFSNSNCWGSRRHC